jgi:hypothetical protein
MDRVALLSERRMSLAFFPSSAYREREYSLDWSCESSKGTRRRGISSCRLLRDFRLWIRATKCRILRSQVGLDLPRRESALILLGIHGAPFGPWDGVEGTGVAGYCPHLSNLFGTWHRPYLALFEQILHDRAVDIANEYPEGEARDNALKVAHKVRLPYWDWALDPKNDEGAMPACLRRTSVAVSRPDGSKSEMPNPLYQYNFHPLKYDDFSILVGNSSEFEVLWSESCSRVIGRVPIQKLEHNHAAS